jgi:hypothetical protein
MTGHMTGTICRIQIPTVLHKTAQNARPQPYVQIAFDHEAPRRLEPHAARIAAEWMAVGAAWGSAPAQALLDALVRCLKALEGAPPLVIENRVSGILEASASSGEPQWLEVGVEMAVLEASSPRIVINSAERPESLGGADTWWMLTDEAERLEALLREAAGLRAAGPIGLLEEKGPNRRPWLYVTVEPDPHPSRKGALGVQLRFDDELIDERGDDGIVWLPGPLAIRLADLVRAALVTEKTEPAHVFERPEPHDVLVAEIPIT